MIDIALRIARQFAPGLVRRLAGDRAASVAETVLNMGGLLTGETDPEQIAARLEADTQLQHEFRMQALQIEAELAALDHKNTADARARDVAIRAAGGDNLRADVLAYGILASWVALLVMVLFFRVPDPWTQSVFDMSFGALTMRLADVVNFEFGSSRGSKNKEAQINRLTRVPDDPDR